MDLIIGRESGVEHSRLSIKQNDKVSFWGTPGSVPKSVSRVHCHVVVANDGKVSIEDVTPNNFIYVNGVECKRKDNVNLTDTIELGPDRYCLKLDAIVAALSSQQSFSIAPLNEVYESYQKERIGIQIKQGRLNALSMLPGILSMISIGVAVFLQEARIYLIVVAAVFALFFALIRYRNANKIPLKLKELDDSFREKYVCPNPTCGRFLGSTPYKELLKNKCCPYCKSSFRE